MVKENGRPLRLETLPPAGQQSSGSPATPTKFARPLLPQEGDSPSQAVVRPESSMSLRQIQDLRQARRPPRDGLWGFLRGALPSSGGGLPSPSGPLPSLPSAQRAAKPPAKASPTQPAPPPPTAARTVLWAPSRPRPRRTPPAPPAASASSRPRCRRRAASSPRTRPAPCP